jgi:hypothetical protein
MDVLSLGLLAIGLLAAIGAVFVAMTESVSEPTRPESASPTPTQTAPDHVVMVVPDDHPLAPLATTNGNDPLHVWLGRQVHLLSADLRKLRQQEDELERRLKLMNGIAVLVQESERTTRRSHPRQSRTESHVSSSTTVESGEL